MYKLIAALFFGILLALASSASAADQEIARYTAHLSVYDHVSSEGVELTTVGQILRQDRYRNHKLHDADSDDEVDSVFSNSSARDRLETMGNAAKMTPAVKKAILTGTPHVVVALIRRSNGEEYIEVDFTN